MEQYRNEQGIYLVRCTQRNDKILVLSMIWNNEFFNYEICVANRSSQDSLETNISNTNNNNNNNGLLFPDGERFFYIDDGPYFRKLSHLIDHYSKYEDGRVQKQNTDFSFTVQTLHRD